MDAFHGRVALIIGSLHSTGADMAELLVNAGAVLTMTMLSDVHWHSSLVQRHSFFHLMAFLLRNSFVHS
jgi:hypothetical protein